jgi:hypothetical protein
MSMLSFDKYNAELLRGKGLMVNENKDTGLSIVRYHKSENTWKIKTHGECDRDNIVVRKHRSVVYSLDTGMPVCVSPVRRIKIGTDEDWLFRESISGNICITKYIDGTMINVFWNKNINSETGEPFGWTLSSRSKLHATCRFTSDHLFNDLFEEARKELDISYDSLNPELCYSFVLVHPETRHVIAYGSPKIYLVSVTKCNVKDERCDCEMFSWENIKKEALRIKDETILPPEIDTTILNTMKQVSESKNTEGWVILSRKGSWGRIRVLTNKYEEALKVRGDCPSRRTNYIRLMSQDPSGDLIKKYASYYPEEIEDIRDLGKLIGETGKELFNWYILRHVRKEKEHTDLPHWTRKPIWELHGRYLRSRQPIRPSGILDYFRSISPTNVNKLLKNREKENNKKTDPVVYASDIVADAAAAAAEDVASASSGAGAETEGDN